MINLIKVLRRREPMGKSSPTLAMTEERIITAAVVRIGEKNDGKLLQTLSRKVRQLVWRSKQ